VFPWRDVFRALCFVSLALYCGFLLSLSKSTLRHEVWDKLLATYIAAILLVAVNFTGVEWLRNHWIASSVIIRASFFIPLITLALIAHLFWHAGTVSAPEAPPAREGNDRLARGLMLLQPAAVIIPWVKATALPYLLPLALVLTHTAAFTPCRLRNKHAFVMLTALGTLITLGFYSSRSSGFTVPVIAAGYTAIVLLRIFTPHTLARGIFPSVAYGFAAVPALALYLLLGVTTREAIRPDLSPLSSPASAHIQSWLSLTHWMRHHTPADAFFLMPPEPGYSAGISRRSHLMDYKNFASCIYVKSATAHELKALKVIYGIDPVHYPAHAFRRLPRRPDTRLRLKPEHAPQGHYGGLLFALKKTYCKIAEDSGRIAAIKKEFPALDYVVTPRYRLVDKSVPKQQRRIKQLNLPLVFQNTDYLVYEIRNLPAS